MKSARETGATRAQIGEALGITKQAAHDFYRRKIEEQEKYLPELHDPEPVRSWSTVNAHERRHSKML